MRSTAQLIAYRLHNGFRPGAKGFKQSKVLIMVIPIEWEMITQPGALSTCSRYFRTGHGACDCLVFFVLSKDSWILPVLGTLDILAFLDPLAWNSQQTALCPTGYSRMYLFRLVKKSANPFLSVLTAISNICVIYTHLLLECPFIKA